MNVLEHSSRKLLLLVAVLVLFASLSFVSTQRPAAATSSSTGILIPLYAYPGPMWQGLIQAKNAYPSVPMIAVINPDNGPGSYQDPNIVNGVQQLQAAGIVVVGYIPTGYASVSLSSVESQIIAYKNLYGLSGVFFDQMSNVLGYEWYYSTLTNYVDSHGMWLSVGNPGTGVPSSFVNTVDILVIYENAGLPSVSLIASRDDGYSASHFAMTPYEVDYLSSSYVSSVSNYLGYLYITNGEYPNQYMSLPPYFDTLVSMLAGGNGASTGSIPLTIQSATTGGSAFNGMWTVIQTSGGSTLATGFTTLSYSVTPGGNYVVSVSNYGNYVFSHWSNGATSNTISVSPTQATTLTAYYNTGSNPGGGGSVTVTVNSVDLSGNPVHGLRTYVQAADGSIVAKGFTPFTFSATSGATYTVTVDNYGSYQFSHWASGSTSRSITIAPTSSMTLTAYYKTSPSSGPVTLTLASSHNGATFNGMWMTIRSSSGSTLATGFTTMKFSATSGATYTITASNYGSLVFSHWSNGSTSRTITVSAGQSLTLIAYYS